MSLPAVLLCCDASAQKGLGHLQRCMVLAKTFVDGGGRAFILCNGHVDLTLFQPLSIELRVLELSPEQERQELVELVAYIGANVLVIDHYRATPAYQQMVQSLGVPWLQFDYRHAFTIQARWVVNITPCAQVADYAPLTEPACTLLLGPRFAILRAEFINPEPLAVGSLRRVLIMLGGGDDAGLAEKFIDWLSDVTITVCVVTTRSNPGMPRLMARAAALAHVEVLVEPKNIAELMRSADLAICAGGTTTFELVSQGLPFLSVAMADNQVELCHAWHARGVCIHMGLGRSLNQVAFRTHWEKIEPVVMRQAMRESARGLADNQGAQRIREAVEKCL
jgi:UDP-2,4-diacetamido-2,4,6-trideoxy-beta-L-altropyranose hydrolase